MLKRSQRIGFASLFVAKFDAECLFINLDDCAFGLAAKTGGNGILIAACHGVDQRCHGAFFNRNSLDVQNILKFKSVCFVGESVNTTQEVFAN